MPANAETSMGSFLLGLGIGAAIAILFAPKSGVETRTYIQSKVNEGKQYAQDSADQVQEQAKTLLNRGEKLVTDEVERIHSAFDAGREAYWQSRANGAANS